MVEEVRSAPLASRAGLGLHQALPHREVVEESVSAGSGPAVGRAAWALVRFLLGHPRFHGTCSPRLGMGRSASLGRALGTATGVL